jgi:hypothetical protein
MRDALSEAIRSVILPRLVAARRARDIGLAHEGDRITEHDVATMLADVLTPDQSVAESMLTLLKLRSVPRSEVLLSLLPAVERRLRSMRAQDRFSDAEFKLALGRLERLVRSKAMPPAPEPGPRAAGTVLVITFEELRSPLAALVLIDMFRSAGWKTIEASAGGRQDEPGVDLNATKAGRRADAVAILAPLEEAGSRVPALAERLAGWFDGPVLAIPAGAPPASGAADQSPAVIWSDLRHVVDAARRLVGDASAQEL